METHSSTLAWIIQWTEEPGRLKESNTFEVTEHTYINEFTNEKKAVFICNGQGN